MASIAASPEQRRTLSWRALAAPVALTAALIGWTWLVSPSSAYGDTWAIVPAALVLPAVACWHIALVVLFRDRRMDALVAGVFHLAVLVPVWFRCLMLISKDSL
jgi:hypothetical protein